MIRSPAWWRPGWFWAAVAVVVLAGLTTASLLRTLTRQPEPAPTAQTVPDAWDRRPIRGLTTVVTAPGPEDTTVRLVAADVTGLGPCLGVIVSTSSLDTAAAPTANSECDATVAAVLTNPPTYEGVSGQLQWQWLSPRTGRNWRGYFGTTSIGATVHLTVGTTTTASTPVARHAYVSAAISTPTPDP